VSLPTFITPGKKKRRKREKDPRKKEGGLVTEGGSQKNEKQERGVEGSSTDTANWKGEFR